MQRNDRDLKYLINRQHTPKTASVINSTIDSNTQLFSPLNRTSNYPYPTTSNIHIKRALSSCFGCIVQKEKKYYEEGILPAFDGPSPFPTQQFGKGEPALNNLGWSRHEEMGAIIPYYWNDALDATPSCRPKKEQVRRIKLEQDRGSTNAAVKQVNEAPLFFRLSSAQEAMQTDVNDQTATEAEYTALYSQTGVIMTLGSHSPSYELGQRGIPNNQLAKNLPVLHTLADALWYEWATLSKTPQTLR
ncbi:MAG: hypothetical protein L6R40_007989 [Gallowayella cf. fulva]|nr:MAG: hypothetical protein L6R40_007989 [Xanthomendoza cf. fulva]